MKVKLAYVRGYDPLIYVTIVKLDHFYREIEVLKIGRSFKHFKV
jgi:hypothetical protein